MKKKIVAVTVVLCLALSFCIPVFAAETETMTEFSYYLYLGNQGDYQPSATWTIQEALNPNFDTGLTINSSTIGQALQGLVFKTDVADGGSLDMSYTYVVRANSASSTRPVGSFSKDGFVEIGYFDQWDNSYSFVVNVSDFTVDQEITNPNFGGQSLIWNLDAADLKAADLDISHFDSVSLQLRYDFLPGGTSNISSYQPSLVYSVSFFVDFKPGYYASASKTGTDNFYTGGCSFNGQLLSGSTWDIDVDLKRFTLRSREEEVVYQFSQSTGSVNSQVTEVTSRYEEIADQEHEMISSLTPDADNAFDELTSQAVLGPEMIAVAAWTSDLLERIWKEAIPSEWRLVFHVAVMIFIVCFILGIAYPVAQNMQNAEDRRVRLEDAKHNRALRSEFNARSATATRRERAAMWRERGDKY